LICSKCGLDKPDSNFRKQGKQCNDCRKQYRYESGFFISKLADAKRRAKEKNLPFNITAEYLKEIWTGYCDVSGKKLLLVKDSDFSPQLDRIIPEKGYVIGNVCWLSARYNNLKSNATIKELKIIIEWMEKQGEVNEKEGNTITG